MARIPVNRLNLTGQIFGKLKVKEASLNRKYASKEMLWICECKCGQIIEMTTSRLRRGFHNHRGCVLTKKKAWNNSSYGQISGQYWSQLLNGARDREILVEISIEDAWNQFLKQKGKCALSGLTLNFTDAYNIKLKYQTASLDRIDSTKSYNTSNIQWVHKDINKMKNTLSEYDFIIYCSYICNYRGNNAITKV